MNRRRLSRMVGIALATSMTLAGCGDNGTADPASPTGNADVAAAKQFIANYVGQPSEFTTEDKLERLPSPGTKVVFVDSGTRVGELQWQLIQPAAKQLGVDLVRVKAGADAASVTAAFDSVVSMKPDGVLIAAVNPVLYATQLDELRKQGATVVGSSFSDGDKYGFGPVTYGNHEVSLVGSLLGAWTIARNEGKATNIALYTIPELPFSDPLVKAAQAKINELCSGCETRIVSIPVAQLGSNAAQTVVSDIQSHPDTQAAIFSTDEIAIGLPSALTVAGLSLSTVGGAPTPANLQQIAEGTEDAGLGVDLASQMWNLVDQFARESTGQKLTGAQGRGELVKQFLTREDITFDPSEGWTGYPDMAERYAELWARASTS